MKVLRSGVSVSLSHRKVLDVIHHQEQVTDLHEQFHSQVYSLETRLSVISNILHTHTHTQLQRSADGFSVVAEYFGRGVFNKVYTVFNDVLCVACIIIACLLCCQPKSQGAK